MTTTFDKAQAELGAPTDVRVVRDGDRDLVFAGWMLGEGAIGGPGKEPSKWIRSTEVRVWLSASGQLVTGARRWSQEHGLDEPRHAAAVHATAEQALAWLRHDAGGRLGLASKRAWDAACLEWSELRGADVEVLEGAPPDEFAELPDDGEWRGLRSHLWGPAVRVAELDGPVAAEVSAVLQGLLAALKRHDRPRLHELAKMATADR